MIDFDVLARVLDSLLQNAFPQSLWLDFEQLCCFIQLIQLIYRYPAVVIFTFQFNLSDYEDSYDDIDYILYFLSGEATS